MPTLSLEPPDHLARFLTEAVTREDYPTVDAAVSDALCLPQSEVAALGNHLAQLWRAIRTGVGQPDVGDISKRSIDDILVALDRELDGTP